MYDDPKPERNNPIFILGTQRSGTTLLTRILSAHPEIFIQNELPLDSIFKQTLDSNQIINNIEKHFILRYQENITDYLLARKNKYWGLKDPQLTEHISSLELFLPNSKFIIIVRDPRGVVNSYIDNKWGLGTNAYSGALRWDKEVKVQIDFCEKYPENTLLLRFEDLIDDLANSLKKVCRHLKIEFQSEMLSYYTKKFEFTANKQNQNTTKAPDASLKNKWKTKLNHCEINNIEYICQDTIKKLDYPLYTNALQPTRLKRLWFKLHQRIVGEFQIQYQLKMAPKLNKLKAKN